ncbi:PAC2 family-domain-containing protein [Cunninghamella echinulata]|nr:PAC2 family-domain-containing protein [Cunninghamella echinulata]
MTSFIPRPSFDITLLKDSHLVLPSVSIGNVPQLTCDLIIHTLQLSRIGFIDSDAVIPVVGQFETNSIGISVPIEVYQSKDQQLTVIQQRSPTLKGKKQDLITTLTEFIQQAQFSKVTLLTSLDAARRIDSQISSNPFRVIGDTTIVSDIYQKCNIPVLETRKEKDDDDTTLPSSLPGGGMTRSLYLSLKEKNINVVIFSIFVLEGDNIQDSIAFANTLNGYYGLNKKDDKNGTWIAPKSWEFLFGTPINSELYL